MLKTLDTTLHKARIFYEHGKLSQDNINRSRDRSRTFSDKHKWVLTHHLIENRTIVFQPIITSIEQVQSHMYKLQMLTTIINMGPNPTAP